MLRQSCRIFAGMSDRISTLEGDYYTAPFGSGYDAVLFSGVLIQESPEGQKKLMKKAAMV